MFSYVAFSMLYRSYKQIRRYVWILETKYAGSTSFSISKAHVTSGTQTKAFIIPLNFSTNFINIEGFLILRKANILTYVIF